ncbi:MAG TPA: aldehyde dehydrogenase family protein [Candidatus Bathyarchaeia archaeon]|nr:aldehyde dehydrogenase family protein [Candidatus Bathyarchaeia archaeon]
MQEVAVRNPRTGAPLYVLNEYSDAEVAAVYDRAQKASDRLRAMSVRQRLDEALKLKHAILKNREKMIDRICEETGKTRLDALMTEIFPALGIIDYYDKNAEKFLRDQKVKTPIALFPKKSRIYYEPLGTVLIISPWNYPFSLSFPPAICAFIAGNAVIMKPSSYAPLRGVYEDMVETAGFIKDAFQVVYGSRITGHKLIEAKPKKIFFTGSVGAGKKVMAQAADHLIPVELELGGKDPMIVFDDVNIERTVNGALWGGFVNSGQTCTSVERLYVQEGIYDPFVTVLKEKLAKLSTHATSNRPDEGDIDMGCMTAEFQIKTVEDQIAEARTRGANIIAGGARKENTHLFAPTLIENVDPSMKVQHEETFGPVITITKFKTEQDAIRLGNDSPYGLSASVWSADLARADRVARALVTGNVSINNVLATQGNSGLPFGGVKDSGFGRYKGPFGLHSFSNIKSILIDKQNNKIELNWYPYSKEKYGLFSQLLDAMFGGGALGLLKTVMIATKLESLCKKRRL